MTRIETGSAVNRLVRVMYAGKKVLVTGGTGMIGRQVVDLLLERGANVRVVSLDDPSLANPGTEFLRGDLTDRSFCDSIVAGMDYVFHVAGIKGSVGIGNARAASFFVPLILMNTTMMEAARRAGVERYLYTSSIAVYEPVDLFIEDKAWDGPPHSTDKYAAWAKRMGELQAEAYQVEYDWDKIAIVRPANVYGPYDNFNPQTAMVIPALIARVAGGETPLTVWGDGSTIRDFRYARDCAVGMLMALEKGANGKPINLGSGQRVAVRQIVDSVLASFDDPPEVVWDTNKPSGQPIRLMDTTRARTEIGFTAATSIEDGVRETVDWYLANPVKIDGRYDAFARAPSARQ